jgi:hypothetical protein
MAFALSFYTQDYNQGKSILIIDSSTGWASVPAGITSVTFTITSLYTGAVLYPTSPVVKTFAVGILPLGTPFVEGFQYEITAEDLFGSGYSGTVYDSIYHIKMNISNVGGIIGGLGNTHTSDEVFYYNAELTRDAFIAEKASYTDNIYDQDMDYANWLDFLVTSIESNTMYGNTSAIYYTFDIFTRLNS